MEAYFFKYEKRKNSTRHPNYLEGNRGELLLKDGADVTAPVVECYGTPFIDYNYVYIPFLGNRWYWINEIRSTAYASYLLTLEVDTLATYLSDIIGQRVYAHMSSNFYSDNLDDTRVVASPEYDWEWEWADLDIFQRPNASNIYNIYQFLSVCDTGGKLNGIDIFFGLTTISDYLKKVADRNWVKQFATDAAGVNPFDAINGAWWCPFFPDKCHKTSTASATIYDVSISGSVIDDPTVKGHIGHVNVPKPSVDDFRYSERFVHYYLVIPYIGVIDVPTELCRHASSLSYSYAGDCLTGQFVFAPTCGGVPLGIFSTSLKSDIQLARQSSKGAQVATSTILSAGAGAIGGAQIGGPGGALIGGVLGGAVGSIGGVAAAPKISRTTSSTGSIAVLGAWETYGSVRLIMVESDALTAPSAFAAIAGRPTQRVITLADNIGYVQCVNASVSIPGLASETETINNLLNGGVYFE